MGFVMLMEGLGLGWEALGLVQAARAIVARTRQAIGLGRMKGLWVVNPFSIVDLWDQLAWDWPSIVIIPFIDKPIRHRLGLNRRQHNMP
jgi:hypothetical protein